MRKKREIDPLTAVCMAAKAEGMSTGQYLAKLQVEEMRRQGFWRQACDMSRDWGDCMAEKRKCERCGYNG